MKFTKMNLIIGGVLAILTFLTLPVYANGGSGRRGGHDDGGYRRSRNDYYRYQRYYPKDYYYHRKVYFYPSRRYYYYYDVYPAKINYYGYEKNYGAVNPDYLPIVSIANMASQGLPDSVIISEIERTGSKYKLDTDTINYLRQNGAGDTVIDYMIKTY
jgi:hypothetical protein